MNHDEIRVRLKSYIPAFDGLRAVAILWVIVHNASVDTLLHNNLAITKVVELLTNMGWLGVQLFFVLSGFLITGILLDGKKRQPREEFKRFYARRFLRIFPIYYAFLVLVILLGFLGGHAPGWARAANQHMGWFLVYLNNWVQPFQDIGLSHLWSLAVEEQFYLLWPMVIILLPFSRLYWICGALILLAPVFRFGVMEWVTDTKLAGGLAYVLTPARMDALAIGAALAISMRDSRFSGWIQRRMPVLLLLFSGYMLLELAVFRSYASTGGGIVSLNQTMAALLFAVLLYYSIGLEQGNRITFAYRRFLCLPWMRAIGKYSYAIYIFHKPVAVALHASYGADFQQRITAWSGATKLAVFFGDSALIILISFSLAWISWRLIEQPFLNLKRKFPM